MGKTVISLIMGICLCIIAGGLLIAACTSYRITTLPDNTNTCNENYTGGLFGRCELGNCYPYSGYEMLTSIVLSQLLFIIWIGTWIVTVLVTSFTAYKWYWLSDLATRLSFISIGFQMLLIFLLLGFVINFMNNLNPTANTITTTCPTLNGKIVLLAGTALLFLAAIFTMTILILAGCNLGSFGHYVNQKGKYVKNNLKE
ncbi:hypothetical protein GJ496_009241 [Pomphorhynchus laevis]|nr:hypothetical protein GJ496_009241 [Pomphorhynchus laevis]